MATIKSFTDIPQSRKLAEILPIESADGGWYGTNNPLAANTKYWLYTKYTEKAALPAWSLVALLNVLPNENILVKTTDGKYYCLAKDVMTKHYDNSVDACYEMILKLNEFKML